MKRLLLICIVCLSGLISVSEKTKIKIPEKATGVKTPVDEESFAATMELEENSQDQETDSQLTL